ncbi:hypothetical protein F8M41_004784 [Gigaspora margarita]|uniref:Uncharacterized protein n=1 Tax=Gigaspora margarita TaxID=4874 RepID=A0A8H4AXR2_GIGMA|nr:hypothetical protein F8M41_004784 [Gigaspora margarita]
MHEDTKRDALKLSGSNLKENTLRKTDIGAAEKSAIREKREKISELQQGLKISAEKREFAASGSTEPTKRDALEASEEKTTPLKHSSSGKKIKVAYKRDALEASEEKEKPLKISSSGKKIKAAYKRDALEASEEKEKPLKISSSGKKIKAAKRDALEASEQKEKPLKLSPSGTKLKTGY